VNPSTPTSSAPLQRQDSSTPGSAAGIMMPFVRNQDAKSQPNAFGSRPVALMTNQFKLRLSQDLSVY
jgi:hypothetical protein